MPKKKVAKTSKPQKKTPNTAKKKVAPRKTTKAKPKTGMKKIASKSSANKSSAKKKSKPNANRNKPASKRTAPRLISKRQEPKKMPSQKTDPKRVNDIPNTTVALLAVLTIIFMIWSAAVFFSNVNYSRYDAPVLEYPGEITPGADLRLRIQEEPRSTATVGLTVLEYVEDNQSTE